MNTIIRKLGYNLKLLYSRGLYSLYNLFSRTKIKPTADRPIVISLTSFSKRIRTVYLTIETLFNQTILPQRIILWLSEEEFPNRQVPITLLRLKKRGLEIRFVKENLRSYKKLIYALQDFPESVIITVDDDTYYPRNWYEEMIESHEKFPNHILCGRGHLLTKATSLKLDNYMHMVQNTPPGHLSGLSLMPTGVSGVLYPPDSLDSRVLDKELLTKLAPYADDIWFKACALLRGTPSMRIGVNNKKYLAQKDAHHSGLAQKNVGENKNDEQLKNVFDYFNLYSYID